MSGRQERADDLPARAQILDEALASGGAELDEHASKNASEVVRRIGERIALSGGRTVVALAGATGSGKSSLFNAFVGEPVASVGAVRPTTATALAAYWGSAPAAELLHWLGVARRHAVAGAGESVRREAAAPSNAGDRSGADDADPMSLDGLVLLDLPDFDSLVVAHRTEVDRLLSLVDVFVWVTDPQKYADARLHEDYVRVLHRHGAQMFTVLNQADRLSAEGVAACRADLSRLLVEDEVADPRVIVTCATDGSGVIELYHEVAVVVAGQRAAGRRLAQDLSECADRLAAGVGGTEADLGGVDQELVEALARGAGVPVVADAVERDYRRRAMGTTGWPFTRWARHLRPSPLRRIGLSRSPSALGTPSSQELAAADPRSVLGRSSLPPASPAARSAIRLSTARLGDRAAKGLPPPWADAVIAAAEPADDDLTDALDQAVVGTSLRTSNPAWWAVVATLQTALAIATVMGFGWLAVLAVIGWLRLPQPYDPTFGPLPVPFVLFVGGLLLGLVFTLLARSLARAGGRRRRELVQRRLREAIGAVATARLVEPVQAVLARHRRTRELLAQLRR